MDKLINSQSPVMKTTLDAVSFLTVLGTLSNVLPALAALFTILWTGIRIWESNTVREWRGKPTYTMVKE